MLEFLLKVWGLARPYRARLAAGVVLGVIGGLLEPLMIATVVFVYGLLFPDAVRTSAMLSAKDIKDASALVGRLSRAAEPVSQYLWDQFPPADQQRLTSAETNATRTSFFLARDLNYVLQGNGLYEPQRFQGVSLSKDTRLMLAENPQGEQLIRLNRLLLDDAYPVELAKVPASPLLARLSWAPEFVRDGLSVAEHTFTGGVKAHKMVAAAVVGLIPLVILLRGLFSYLNIYCLQWVAIRAITDLRVRLFRHLISLSAGFFSQMRTGELITRVMNDTGTLQTVLSNATSVIVKDPVILISLAAYLLWQQTRLTLISMVVMPVCMVPVLIYNRKVRRSARELQNQAADLGNVMAESFSGYRIVKAYNLEDKATERFRVIAAKFIGHIMRLVRSLEIPGPLLEFVGAVGVALVLLYLMLRTDSRPAGTDFLAVVLSIFAMYRPLKNLTRLYATLEQARAASGRIFELLATPNNIAEPAQPKPLKAAGAVIHFDGVDFAYDDKQVLRGVNLKIQPGQLVALVGQSGSGKTTLTNLLLRFYDPQRGAVRIGATDIREFSTHDLRSQIALVTQETFLFNDSVRNNIAIGRPGATNAEIEAAAKHAYAQEFILGEAQGYERVVGEKGVSLSGGQRQRIAIARAIVKDAPILVLDEATNALDAESERAVQAALEELMIGRTTICIAHRLSTIQRADCIVVLDRGRIVETGTHAELLKAHGIYRKVYELQFEQPAA